MEKLEDWEATSVEIVEGVLIFTSGFHTVGAYAKGEWLAFWEEEEDE